MSGSYKPPTQRIFTIVELDDLGVPEGDGVVHTEVIDTANRWRNTVECIFRLPDTDEHYRFYYHSAKPGQTALAWYDDFHDGNVPCVRVVNTPTVVRQWRSVDQAIEPRYAWGGAPGRHTKDGMLLPLTQDGEPAGTLLLPEDVAEHLIRVLGGTPHTRKPSAGLVKASVLAEMLDLPVNAINHMRAKGQLPAQRVPNGLYYYDPEVCRAALEERQNAQLSLDDEP